LVQAIAWACTSSSTRAIHRRQQGDWDDLPVTNTQTDINGRQLLRRGFALEYVTLGY
jgi:hypothetical protein